MARSDWRNGDMTTRCPARQPSTRSSRPNIIVRSARDFRCQSITNHRSVSPAHVAAHFTASPGPDTGRATAPLENPVSGGGTMTALPDSARPPSGGRRSRATSNYPRARWLPLPYRSQRIADQFLTARCGTQARHVRADMTSPADRKVTVLLPPPHSAAGLFAMSLVTAVALLKQPLGPATFDTCLTPVGTMYNVTKCIRSSARRPCAERTSLGGLL
jgi:hypothetical protein